MIVDIIIIGYGLPEMEAACLRSVIENTKAGTYVLTFVDNFKTETSLTHIWNTLIARSKCPYICLLNSDTKATPAWLDKLIHPFTTMQQVGFTGPSTNNCHSPQKTIPTYEAAQKHTTCQIMEEPISGFCVTFPRALWKKLDGFDERFHFYGAESDFIDRAKKLGFSCVWVKNSFVYHIGEASIKKSGMDVNEARQNARKLYWATRGGAKGK